MSLEFLRPDPWQFCAFVSLNVKAHFLSREEKAVAESVSCEAEYCGGLGRGLSGVDACLVCTSQQRIRQTFEDGGS